LTWRVRDGRLPRNPAAGARLPRATIARKQFHTAAKVAVLADASGRNRVFVYVLAYCGLRFGEAAGLRVDDVDLTRRRLRVERSITDVDGHLVATTPEVPPCAGGAGAVIRRRDADGHRRRSPMPPSLPVGRWAAPGNKVQRMLGHASAAMTLDVYAGLFGDDRTPSRTGPTRPAGRLLRTRCGVS